MTRSRRHLTLLAIFWMCAELLASCGHGPATTAPALKVAFFQDLSVDDAVELVSPAFFGLDIGLSENGAGLSDRVGVQQFDTQGIPSRALVLAHQVAADPTYLAVVIAPFWAEPPEVARVFADAGLPVLSLSPDGVPGGSQGTWRGLVPEQKVQARTLASVLNGDASRGGSCLGTDPAPYSASLSAQVSAALDGPLAATFQMSGAGPVGPIVRLVLDAGCSTVAWIGFPQGAAALRDALTAAGLGSVRMVGADPMKTLSYIQQTGRDGTLVTCPCQDITTSSQLAAEQLVHDYQVVTGLEPGVYAAEAWDAAGMIMSALRAGVTDRAAMSEAIGGLGTYAGVARLYRFGPDGWPVTAPRVGIYRAQGVRWLVTESFR